MNNQYPIMDHDLRTLILNKINTSDKQLYLGDILQMVDADLLQIVRVCEMLVQENKIQLVEC